MSLYSLTKKDLKQAGLTLAHAFKDDPMWEPMFKGYPIEYLANFMEGAILYGIKYGKAYAPSDKIEGVIVWIPSKYVKMTFFRMLRCGMLFHKQLLPMKKMMEIINIISPLEKEKYRIMDGKEYNYLYVVGVHPDYQGLKLGSRMIKAYLDELDSHNLYGYLETATLENVSIYNHYGFKERGKIMLDKINAPAWTMVRKSKKQ